MTKPKHARKKRAPKSHPKSRPKLRHARRAPREFNPKIFGEVIGGKRGLMLESTDRNMRGEIQLTMPSDESAQIGDFVEAEMTKSKGVRRRNARFVRKLDGAKKSLSALAVAEFELPEIFSDDALTEAEKATMPDAKSWQDCTDIPFVTIDGKDAKDFDDAVYAEPHGDGWRVVVAIADVGFYVAEDSALDREARARGNSVYLPDMVLPMLPEALSNELCSLKPDVVRAAILADIMIDAKGRKQKHHFTRARIRSRARLTYDEVESYLTKANAPPPQNLPPEIIRNLHSAWQCLDKARIQRGALALNLAEKNVRFDAKGTAVEIVQRFQTTARKSFEELMILANVAAAETLEEKRQLCVYRTHDAPDPERVATLHEICHAMGLAFAKGQVMRAKDFNHLLKRGDAQLGQATKNCSTNLSCVANPKANYRISNVGHYGLALQRYAHFTSPIRRYADLLVHRALMGENTLPREIMSEICTAISASERRAATAERRTIDRFAAKLMQQQNGKITRGRITNITRFGAFLELAEFGTEGLLPRAQLPADYYHIDTNIGIMRGDTNGIILRCGEMVDVFVISVSPVKGAVLLGWVGADGKCVKPTPPRHRYRRRAR